MKIERFEDIEAWKEARKLARLIYEISRTGLLSRDYGLRDQIQRASVSIMSNIAEGFESQTDKEFVKFLYYAKRSAGEVRSQLYVILDQEYINRRKFDELYSQVTLVSKLISKFISYLERSEGQKVGRSEGRKV